MSWLLCHRTGYNDLNGTGVTYQFLVLRITSCMSWGCRPLKMCFLRKKRIYETSWTPSEWSRQWTKQHWLQQCMGVAEAFFSIWSTVIFIRSQAQPKNWNLFSLRTLFRDPNFERLQIGEWGSWKKAVWFLCHRDNFKRINICGEQLERVFFFFVIWNETTTITFQHSLSCRLA